MISFFWIIAFLTLLSLTALILWALIWWLRRSGADRRSPLTRNLLRNPGDSLRPQLEDLAFDMMGLLCLLLIIPIVVYSMWITELHFGTTRVTTFDVTSRLIFTLIALGFVSYRILIVMKRRRALFLGLDGEMAIGQELNQLMLKGYAVYHDFPADRFNIDHIVVAPGGVFAVETKARPKPVTEDGKASAEVVFDGSSLRFPTWENRSFLEQATRQAKWLSRWLTSAVGEPVEAKPVLALPGWYIKRVQRGPVQVISGRDAEQLVRAGDLTFSPPQMQRIVHQVEARCRTVEPRGYARRNTSTN